MKMFKFFVKDQIPVPIWEKWLQLEPAGAKFFDKLEPEQQKKSTGSATLVHLTDLEGCKKNSPAHQAPRDSDF
jgi:hypothetical protein